MRILLISFIFFLSGCGIAFSQSDVLAKNYFNQGEYEKALNVYERLYQQSPSRLEYFLQVIKCHQQLEDLDKAERLLKEKLNQARNFPQLFVELGYNYSLQGKPEQAKENFNQAIESIESNTVYAYTIGRTFEAYGLLEEAALLYSKAMELNDRLNFNMQLARIYGEQGEFDKMFDNYLKLVENNSNFKNTAKRYFSLYIEEDPNTEANQSLRKILLNRLQQNPDLLYNELLGWLFIQQREYSRALAQEKAIFRRTDDFTGIFDLAVIAIDNKDYKTGREAADYIIENSFTPQTRLEGNLILIDLELRTAGPGKYPEIKEKFENLLDEFGREAHTHLLQIEYNHFLAFKMAQSGQAVENLKELLKQSLTPIQQARVKMELADILVLKEQFNSALIYYSQIQRAVQNNILSQEARFKVARTSYFKGDFEWALAQLDVLKKSTSQLIANDAMALSLLIKDNSLEDSTQTGLRKYARADLLAFQEKNNEAIAALDEVLKDHAGESIEDEAWMKQAGLYEILGEYEKAEKNYLSIITEYGDDILADKAHFRLAELYETRLKEPQKAKEHYERIIFEHADSIYFVEARRKYRQLRGDAIN